MLKIEITFPLTVDEQKALSAMLALPGAEHVEMEAKQTEPTPAEVLAAAGAEMKAAVERASTAAKKAGAAASKRATAATKPTPEPEPEEETVQAKALDMASELVKAKKAALVREALEAVGGTKASELDEEQAQAFVDFLNEYPAEEEPAAPAKKAAAKKAAPKPAEDDDLLGDDDEARYTPEHAMQVASALVKDKKAAIVRAALTTAGASKVTELEGEDQIKTFIEAIDEALAEA